MLATPDVETNEVIIAMHGMQSNCMKKRDEILGKKLTTETKIAYFSFNNRGHELMSYIKRTDGNNKPDGGTSYENFYDSYYDIKAAIERMRELGYTKIHLQGHSLGCTKIVYTYNRLKEEESELLDFVKSVILLSLIDIVGTQQTELGEKRYSEYLNYARALNSQNRETELMPKESFMHPISAKTYLTYFGEGNERIDFARFWDKYYHFKELNNITVPLFMRWGTIYEFVEQELDELIPFLKNRLYNKYLDIDYIGGADHGYSGKEETLADQITFFIKYIAKEKE